ncbi:acetyl-CoA hydrolase/transferase C-terminal domain-containing protein [Oscillibacter sp.]|uniref:acetyl-CoA hydrolase/transferase family protein n=1 Tax=Oscillibacter sp. TaxID=1945593 RepID=UPI00289B752E|nr:acetyl-CoA hydrolase/transferase C-terminal domain-containing protein [Oscillibacter sp.]
MDWKATYQDKIVSAAQAVKCVKSGDTVVLQQAAGTAMHLMDALTDRASELKDVKVIAHNIWETPRFLEPQYAGIFRHVSQFLDRGTRQAYREGRVDPLPAFYYQMPKYYREHPADVFFVMLTEPDEEGNCSYALNADYSVANMEAAKTVVAQINPSLPWTYGAKVSLDKLDYIVIQDQPLPELTKSETGGVEEQIAAHIVPFIQDGACLQLGIGGLPNAILNFLKDKKHLGIHSEVLSDGIIDLYESGAIDNSCKTLDKGKIVSNFLIGTKRLFDFADHNPDLLVVPVDYTNDPYVIAQNDNVISINSCLQVDLLGQVNADTIGGRQYSGCGGQIDFVRGAQMSKGGKSFITLPSTAKKGAVSRIIPHMETGTPVTTSRFDVQYICTEYGVVNLSGKTVSQRAEALIGIAHPDFREELRRQAVEEGLIW